MTKEMTIEDLKHASWEYTSKETNDVEGVHSTIDGKDVEASYQWGDYSVHTGGCHIIVDGKYIDEIEGMEAQEICEMLEKITGLNCTRLTYEMWESWAAGEYEDFAEKDEFERWEMYQRDKAQA